MQGGHALGLGGEGDLVDARVGFVEVHFVQAGLGSRHYQGTLGRVAFDVPAVLCLAVDDMRIRSQYGTAQQLLQRVRWFDGTAVVREPAVRIISCARNFEHLAHRIDFPHRHLILGERAGLVGADNGCAAQGLHGWQAPDERIALDHALYTDRQRDGDHCRQGLGNDRHRQGNTEQDHLDERLAAKQAEPNDHRHDDEGGACQRSTDLVEVLLQGSPAALHCMEHLGDLAEFRFHAGGSGKSAAPSIGDCRAAVDHVLAIADGQGSVRAQDRPDVFFDRQGFACQCGLLHLQVDRFDQARIGGDLVPGPQDDHISRHHLPGRDLFLLPIPQHGGGWRGHFL